MKELCLIVNPISGGKDKSGILAAVEKHLDGSLYEHRLLFTERAGQAEEMSGLGQDGLLSFSMMALDARSAPTATSKTSLNPMRIRPRVMDDMSSMRLN